MSYTRCRAQGMDADTALAAIRRARPVAEISYPRDAISWWQRNTPSTTDPKETAQ